MPEKSDDIAGIPWRSLEYASVSISIRPIPEVPTAITITGARTKGAPPVTPAMVRQLKPVDHAESN